MNKILLISVLYLFAFFNSINSQSLDEIIDSEVRFNNWSAAKTSLDNYLRSNTADHRGYSIYAQVLFELGNLDASISNWQKAVSYAPDDFTKGKYVYGLATSYYKKGLYDIAFETFNKALTFNPAIPQSYYMMGLISFNKKNLDQTVQYWTKYVQLTQNLDKKRKIEEILSKINKTINDEKLRKEEEERRKRELLEQLQRELDDKNSDTKTLEEYKINKNKDTSEDFEFVE